MNVVPCLAWVRRGVSKDVPDKIQLDQEELKRIIEDTKDEITELEEEEAEGDNNKEGCSDSDVEEEEPQPSSSGLSQQDHTSTKPGKRKMDDDDQMDPDDKDIVDKYGLDDYDDEEINFQNGIGNLVCFADNKEDPYITAQDQADSDEEDVVIKPTDNLIAVGRALRDASLLEIYVYDEPGGNLFVHHDIILPSFPLAVEWLDYDASDERPGNFVAIGTMGPTIDIWDLDLIDNLEPTVSLGTKKSKKSNKKKGSVLGHSDAVLDLSWNRNNRNVLASASADFTVGLWDLAEAKAVSSIRKHEEKVQCVKWHPAEPQTLLTGSYDKTVRLFDCRDANYNHKSWNFGAEIERIVWNHFNPFFFYASTDKGNVYYADVRYDKPVYTISAHSDAVSGLVLSSTVENMLVTASSDKTVKVWDVKDNQPKHVVTKDLNMGEVMCALPCPDSPFVFAFGGQTNLKVWDIRQCSEVKQYFNTGEAFGICLENTGVSDGEDDDDVLAKKTKGLKIRTPRVKPKMAPSKKGKKKKKKSNM